MRGVKVLLAFLGAALAVGGCAEESTTLLVELVPNPEVNTRADVIALVNTLEVVVDAEGGFAELPADEGESWGPYQASDVDGDGDLELTLGRPGGREALDPFAFEQGSQGDRVIGITVRGVTTTPDEVAALGGSAARFEPGQQTEVEVPFNLVPAFRPLRVLSMNPAQGAQGLTSPVTEISVQLGGEVQAEALEGAITLRDSRSGDAYAPLVTPSYVDSALGRLTNVKLTECILYGGEYTLALSTEICSVTGQCLDQFLGVEGAQPFEGSFSIDGTDQPPECADGVMLAVECTDTSCDLGYDCDDELGRCIQATGEFMPEGGGNPCEPSWCLADDGLVCDPVNGCVLSCAPWGACLDPTRTCDLDTGVCVSR
jgi:hypothetical protein